MQRDAWTQTEYGVRFEWGRAGATQVAGPEDTLVIVDVLSFTTAVGIAVERGVAVYPAASPGSAAARLARDVGAVLAVGRHDATKAHPWSLSPAALRSSAAPGRLVLPSPNGSAIAAAAEQRVVVAASLRNARAVGTWLGRRPREVDDAVTVIAAGEQWPDGSLRPALEDLLGAGAVLASLHESGRYSESPEAAAARRLYEATESVETDIRRCASAMELSAAGFAEDVEAALEIDATDLVPVLRDGAFQRF